MVETNGPAFQRALSVPLESRKCRKAAYSGIKKKRKKEKTEGKKKLVNPVKRLKKPPKKNRAEVRCGSGKY